MHAYVALKIDRVLQCFLISIILMGSLHSLHLAQGSLTATSVRRALSFGVHMMLELSAITLMSWFRVWTAYIISKSGKGLGLCTLKYFTKEESDFGQWYKPWHHCNFWNSNISDLDVNLFGSNLFRADRVKQGRGVASCTKYICTSPPPSQVTLSHWPIQLKWICMAVLWSWWVCTTFPQLVQTYWSTLFLWLLRELSLWLSQLHIVCLS